VTSRRAILAALAPVVTAGCGFTSGGAPDFAGQSMEGVRFTRESLKGRPVLIQFWATWCGYCRRDQPALDQLAYDHLGRLHVLAVNVGEDARTVRAALAESPRRGQIVLSEDTNLVDVFHPAGFPYYVLLSADSEILGVQRGSAGEEGLKRLLRRADL
jgi:thiol-disulfide isomerase/thioredoxin